MKRTETAASKAGCKSKVDGLGPSFFLPLMERKTKAQTDDEGKREIPPKSGRTGHALSLRARFIIISHRSGSFR